MGVGEMGLLVIFNVMIDLMGNKSGFLHVSGGFVVLDMGLSWDSYARFGVRRLVIG